MKQADIEVTYIGHYGDDLTVVNAARVSFHKESDWDTRTYDEPRELLEAEGWKDVSDPDHWDMVYQRLSESDTKLIRYLAKHKHFSPFNHAFLSFRVKMPLFVARQMVKHKFLPWNEVSRRYVDDPPEFYIPEDYRAKADNVKQGSSEETVSRVGVDETPKDVVQSFSFMALQTYQELLDAGVAPEMARMVLPQNMMTEVIWSGTLGAWCDMLRLRLDKHAQYESRIVAQKIYEQVEPLFPVSVKALLNNE